MRKIYILFFFTCCLLLSNTSVGMLLNNGEPGFGFSSSITLIPKKPSSGSQIEKYRAIHASLILKSGLEFSFGHQKENNVNDYIGEKSDKKPYDYLSLSYYIKDKSYSLGFHIKTYDGLEYERKPKEFGASFCLKDNKQKLTPYIKYTLRQIYSNHNLELITYGGFLTLSKFIFSFSYTFPFHMPEDIVLYNSKGSININTGFFLN